MKKLLLVLLFFPLIFYGQTYFKYAERDAKNQVDWSKVGNDINGFERIWVVGIGVKENPPLGRAIS